MAATHITISNTKSAIDNNIIKGEFNEDNTIFHFTPIMYKNKNKEYIYSLQIKLLNNDTNEMLPITDSILNNDFDFKSLGHGVKAAIETISGQVGGKIREVAPTYIDKIKNVGKKNETNIITQAFRDAYGLYNKKLQKTGNAAASESIMPSDGVAFDGMPPNEMPLPMTINKNNKLIEEDFTNGVTIQIKYNGVRWITYKNAAGDIIKYSRNGKLFSKKSMPIISNELEILFNNCMDYGALQELLGLSYEDAKYYNGATPYWDGELYKHGMTLQAISGQARKMTSTIDLDYYIYDVFFPNAIASGHHLTSAQRQKYIDYIFSKIEPFGLTHIKRVDNYEVHNTIEVKALFDEFLNNMYEGAIARKNNGIYEYSYNNHRSKDLVKLKPHLDDEFEIVGFTQGNKGKDLGAIIWVCCVEQNKELTFTVMPNMAISERKKLFKKLTENEAERENYIGKKLTVSYSELSATGVPQQPKGVAIRDYE